MNNFLNLVEGFTLLSLVKLLVVLLLLVYTVFSGLMTTQIASMNKAVKIKDGFVIKVLGYLHLIFATIVLLLAVFIL